VIPADLDTLRALHALAHGHAAEVATSRWGITLTVRLSTGSTITTTEPTLRACVRSVATIMHRADVLAMIAADAAARATAETVLPPCD
jgi:hypothetical protein